MMDPYNPNSLRLQQRAARWHIAAFPERNLDRLFAKGTEEWGEIARALVGEEEDRPDRGDVVDECVDTVVCLLVLVGQHYSDRNLLAEVVKHLTKLEGEQGIDET
jgi:NTP pyrophosphatase (non-canonical NTP hydrolase)